MVVPEAVVVASAVVAVVTAAVVAEAVVAAVVVAAVVVAAVVVAAVVVEAVVVAAVVVAAVVVAAVVVAAVVVAAVVVATVVGRHGRYLPRLLWLFSSPFFSMLCRLLLVWRGCGAAAWPVSNGKKKRRSKGHGNSSTKRVSVLLQWRCCWSQVLCYSS